MAAAPVTPPKAGATTKAVPAPPPPPTSAGSASLPEWWQQEPFPISFPKYRGLVGSLGGPPPKPDPTPPKHGGTSAKHASTNKRRDGAQNRRELGLAKQSNEMVRQYKAISETQHSLLVQQPLQHQQQMQQQAEQLAQQYQQQLQQQQLNHQQHLSELQQQQKQKLEEAAGVAKYWKGQWQAGSGVFPHVSLSFSDFLCPAGKEGCIPDLGAEVRARAKENRGLIGASCKW